MKKENKRSNGLLGRKVAMTQVFNKYGDYQRYLNNEFQNESYNMQDIILISDIHSEPTGLERAIKLARDEDKYLIILGDLFDRGSDPIGVTNLIYDNLDMIRLVWGNHDDMLFHAFDLYEKNDKLASSNTNMLQLFLANDYKNYTVNGLTQESGSYNHGLLYNKKFRDVVKEENKEIFDKLLMIKKFSKKYIILNNYNGFTIRLSHSGYFTDENSANSNNFYWGLEPSGNVKIYRIKNNIIDICGHWSQPHLLDYLNKMQISYEKIEDSIYIHKWRAIYIDNGFSTNVVNLEDIIPKCKCINQAIKK